MLLVLLPLFQKKKGSDPPTLIAILGPGGLSVEWYALPVVSGLGLSGPETGVICTATFLLMKKHNIVLLDYCFFSKVFTLKYYMAYFYLFLHLTDFSWHV